MKKVKLGYHHKKQFDDRTEYYNENGKLHRTDGPAIEGSDGSKSWWLNGKLHRTDGPAFEGSDGTKEWWLNGKLHRTDGPAYEYSDGTKEWWLNGEQLTELQHQKGEHMAKQQKEKHDGLQWDYDQIRQQADTAEMMHRIECQTSDAFVEALCFTILNNSDQPTREKVALFIRNRKSGSVNSGLTQEDPQIAKYVESFRTVDHRLDQLKAELHDRLVV